MNEYRVRHERAMADLADDGTLDRCSAGGPGPPAGDEAAAEWRRRTWAPWHGFEVRQCAGQEFEGRTSAQVGAYCECLYAVIEPRWSMREYRTQYDEVMRALDADGSIARCSADSTTAPAPPSP